VLKNELRCQVEIRERDTGGDVKSEDTKIKGGQELIDQPVALVRKKMSTKSFQTTTTGLDERLQRS
jgi:hypothetical protein